VGQADFLNAESASLPKTSMVAFMIVETLFAIALMFVLFQLLKQQGRILLRLDGLERDVPGLAPALGTRPLSESRIVRDGLKAGTPAPGFSLPDIHGGTVSLDQFRGRRVLLVFSDPQCGPCDALAPKLVRFHRKHGNNALSVIMIGRGDLEENKKKAMEHGIAFPVVLQERWKLSRQYGIFATPAGFLIGQDGVLVRNVAVGPDEVVALAREGAASN
jgi:peroxiredoxin